jgi:superfamily II DNA/RNA helicase
VELHGNLSQAARERSLSAFSAGSTRVLVATDIAARGIHVDEIALVVHVDPPAEHKAYLHRSGRTARAGASGVVITIMTPDQRKDVRSLTRAAAIEPTITQVNAAHPLIAELVGPAAPKVKPSPAAAAAEPAHQPSRHRGPNRSSAKPAAGGPRRSGAPSSGRRRSGR